MQQNVLHIEANPEVGYGNRDWPKLPRCCVERGPDKDDGEGVDPVRKVSDVERLREPSGADDDEAGETSCGWRYNEIGPNDQYAARVWLTRDDQARGYMSGSSTDRRSRVRTRMPQQAS